MNITNRVLAFALLGAEWVMWLLFALSVVSIAIMIERWRYFHTIRSDFESLAGDLKRLLNLGKLDEARKHMAATRGVEAAVVRVGLDEFDRGADAAEEAMIAARTRERLSLERNLAFLGTVGANAPFIGLFGTVIGIVKAFHDLSRNLQGGAQVAMGGISEALVATAIGLFVAIPAVVAFNVFQRKVRAVMANTEALSRLLLAHLKARAGTETHKAVAAE